jgi:hypothetical protein
MHVHMSTISRVVGETKGARWLPERDPGADLPRRTLPNRLVTMVLEVLRDPVAKAKSVAQGRTS